MRKPDHLVVLIKVPPMRLLMQDKVMKRSTRSKLS